MTFNPLANDSPDLLPASVKIISAPQHGTATVDPASGLITFTPAEHFSGKDQMSYQACNASGSCSEASVALRVSAYGNYRIVAGFSAIFEDTVSDVSATYIMNPDGSGIQSQPIARGLAIISPDGTRIATVEGDTVTVQPIDSPSLVSIIHCQAPGQIQSAPSWSPDSTQLTFTAPSADDLYDGDNVIYTVQPPLSVLSACKPNEIVGGASSAPIRGFHPNWGVGGIAFDFYLPFDNPRTAPPGIFTISPGGDPMQYNATPFSSYPAWSPDGSAIAYVVNSPGGNAIFINDKPILSGLPPVENVAWSPDGSKLAFAEGAHGGQLVVVDPNGSQFSVITGGESQFLNHVSWDPRPITPPPSPTSRPLQIAFRQIDQSGQSTMTPTFGGVGRMSASGSGRTLIIQDTLPFLIDGTTRPKWSPDRSKILFSIAHDTEADILDYRYLGFLASALFTMNPDGSNPAPIPNLPPNEDIIYPAYSPDGSRIVFSMRRLTAVPQDTGHCIWTSAVDGLNLKQLTPCTFGMVNSTDDMYPTWSPDGQYIAYLHGSTSDVSHGNLVIMNADGSNRQQVTDPGLIASVYGAPAWSPDETKLAVGTLYGLRVGSFTPGSGAPPKNFLPLTRFAVQNAVLRPDDLDGGVPIVSPTWSPDGEALAYLGADGTVGFNGDFSNVLAIWVINADGTRPTQISSFGEKVGVGLLDLDWGHPNNLQVQDVTSSVAITRGGFRYDRLTKQYVQTVTLENISSSPLPAPLSLVLDSLSLSATLVNNNGVTKANPPYNSFYIDVTAGPLAPGASASVNLEFTNVGSAPITYGTTVLAGPGQR